MQDVTQIVHEDEDYQEGPDKLFGVCLTIGEELGFDPFYLRVALIILLVFSPVAVVASYVGLGAVVLLSRFLFPRPKAVPASEQVVETEAVRVEEELPLAA